jgi:hypothetical protein
LHRRIPEQRQRPAHVGGVALALRRQQDAFTRALQKVEAEILLEISQLMADRAAGEAKFLRRPPDAAMASESI